MGTVKTSMPPIRRVGVAIAGIGAAGSTATVAVFGFMLLVGGLGWVTTIGALILFPIAVLYVVSQILIWNLWFLLFAAVAAAGFLVAVAALSEPQVRSRERAGRIVAVAGLLAGLAMGWIAWGSWRISWESGGWVNMRTTQTAAKMLEAVDVAQGARAGVRQTQEMISIRVGHVGLARSEASPRDVTSDIESLRRRMDRMQSASRRAIEDKLVAYERFHVKLASESLEWVRQGTVPADTPELDELERLLSGRIASIASTHRGRTEELTRLVIMESTSATAREDEMFRFWQGRLLGQARMLDYMLPGFLDRVNKEVIDDDR